MKGIIKFCYISLVLLSACSKEETLSERDKVINKLAGTWSDAKVTHATDGDISFQYETLKVILIKEKKDSRDGYFIIENGGRAFPEMGGPWRLSADLSKIEINPSYTWDFNLLNDTLTLEFDIPNRGGRLHGMSGRVVIDLKKEG